VREVAEAFASMGITPDKQLEQEEGTNLLQMAVQSATDFNQYFEQICDLFQIRIRLYYITEGSLQKLKFRFDFETDYKILMCYLIDSSYTNLSVLYQ
jgi:uncharacterized protein YydD (DUF2326 family)